MQRVVGASAAAKPRCSAQASPPPQQAAPLPPRQAFVRRRSLLALSATTLAALVAVPQLPARAAENAGGVPSESSPLIQDLLKKTEAKREERKKERLDDYYRRNFVEYFEESDFQSNSPPGTDSETQRAIQQWLEKNKAPALPADAVKARAAKAAQ